MAGGGGDVLGAGEEDGMKDDVGEIRITFVAVCMPVGTSQVNLDVAAHPPSVDKDLRAEEVRASSAIPVTLVEDLNFGAGRRGHWAADFAGSP